VSVGWSEVLGGEVVPVKSSGDDDLLGSEDSFKLSSERTQMVVRIKHLESELFNKEKEFEQIRELTFRDNFYAIPCVLVCMKTIWWLLFALINKYQDLFIIVILVLFFMGHPVNKDM
jgi:hypothetical protein